MSYGQLPVLIGTHQSICSEMMFYQDMPIKMAGQTKIVCDPRITNNFGPTIGAACCDFVGQFGLDAFVKCYTYVCAKYMWQDADQSFNRPKYHTDGFMSDDINYIWSNVSPTVFSKTKFVLSDDDCLSMHQMEVQANQSDEVQFDNCCLLRLNQFVVHKVARPSKAGMRAFLKVTFSKDKFDLEGNSHNHSLDYKWDMRPRGLNRNVPQVK